MLYSYLVMNTTGFSSQPHKSAHPIAFLILILPFGIIQGYIAVTYAYIFAKAGVSVEAIAALVGAGLLPQVFKFLWAPLVDASLTLKKWYILSGIVTAACFIAMGLAPIKVESIPFLTTVSIIGNVAVSFLGTAVNGLAAHDTPDEQKGRVGGYIQAGNLGGTGIGGGLGLWLAQQFPNPMVAAASLSVLCLLCCLPLIWVHEHPSTVKVPHVGRTIQNLFKDIFETLKTRMGILAMILCFLPLGTGAAANLWAAVADNWKATAGTVAFVTGIMSGFITAAGCLVGGWICDRYNRQIAYVVFGLLQAACTVAMAYCPHTELMYILWTSAYAFALGLAYSGFSAFVFEAIGRGAAATKFTVYASLSNAPIYYMTIVDGWAHTHHGPSAMLLVEAGFAVLGALVFAALVKFAGNRQTQLIVSN